MTMMIECSPLAEEAIAVRAFRLGARFATLANMLFEPRPQGQGISRMRMRQLAEYLKVRRVSGQTPKEPRTALSAQMGLHVSIVVDAFNALPDTLPIGVRVTLAYEFYARQMCTVADDGSILDRANQPLPAGGSVRDHPALPPLTFDRAAMYITRVVLPRTHDAHHGKCRSCQTPVWLPAGKVAALYVCACCSRRLDSGRVRKIKPAAS